MKLLTLLIANFRGIASLLINAWGKNVNIYGSNGKGKTTTEDAFLWLLFGKDSADKKDYDLIPHRAGIIPPESDIGCGKEPVVEASLEYFGKTVKLKKSYIEEWPKKGEFKGQYAGSKTHFFVDDLEVKAGEYQSVVSELVDDKLFKLITNPKYFSEVMTWQERRETLVKIVGELDMSPTPELATLMQDRPFSNIHALAKQNVKAAQKQLDGIPYAITEARRMILAQPLVMPDVSALTAQKNELDNQLQTLKNDDTANVKRREIAQIETDIAEARNKYVAGVDAENRKIKDGIRTLEDQRREKANLLLSKADAGIRLESEISDLIKRKEKKLAEWHSTNDCTWTGSETCPTCGQSLPVEQVETAKATFNRQHSEDLEQLVSEGKALAAQIEEKHAQAELLQTESDTLDSKIATLDLRVEKGRTMIKPYAFETTIEFKNLNGKLYDLENAPTADDSKQEKISAICGEIEGVNSALENANRIKLQIEQAAEQEKHVAELMAQEKDLNAELGKWEKAVNLCEQHVKASAKALETAVNGKFKIARFRLFAMQKNGEEAECCDVVYPNGSTNLSTGERLQTGIDIISTLSEYYGVDAPIWIDNAEGITLDIESKAQLINLIVTVQDTKLRVEVEA